MRLPAVFPTPVDIGREALIVVAGALLAAFLMSLALGQGVHQKGLGSLNFNHHQGITMSKKRAPARKSNGQFRKRKK